MAVCICFSQEKEDLSGITIRILEDLVEEVGVGGGQSPLLRTREWRFCSDGQG
jgi:hypothetical protein